MSFLILCVCIASFYGAIWFFDSFFKSCMHYPYFAFLEGTGLKIGILNFSWTTAACNRLIQRWGTKLNKVLRKWFTCGFIITIWLFLPFAVWTLFSLIIQHFSSSVEMNNVPEVKAMLPGVNIPVSEFWIYFLAIGVSSVLHELGHALAAVQDDVQLIAVGVQVFSIVPIAFVQLNTEHLNSVAISKRLKIYCAGIWHNIVVALFAVLLFFSTPFLFSIAYDTNVGVKVLHFSDDSPLQDVRGLEKDDVITAINGCEVKNRDDYQRCLRLAHDRYGICTSAEFVSQNDAIMAESIKDNNVVECCRKDDLFGFCFEYMEPKSVVDSVLPGQYSCLKPRDMVEDKFIKCTEEGGYACPRGLHCLKPSLNNHTYLIITDRNDNNPVLFLGLPYDIYKTVEVSQYFPKLNVLSEYLPLHFEKFLQYVFMFSLGIAFINVLPCYGTDGHHIARSLLQLLAKYMNKNSEFVTISTILTVFVGSALTIPLVVYLFVKAFYLQT